ncbi:MAG: hypothetical protein WCJ58_05775 [bacterium]
MITSKINLSHSSNIRIKPRNFIKKNIKLLTIIVCLLIILTLILVANSNSLQRNEPLNENNTQSDSVNISPTSNVSIKNPSNTVKPNDLSTQQDIYQRKKITNTTDKIIIPVISNTKSDFADKPNIKGNLELNIPSDWNIDVTSKDFDNEYESGNCITFIITNTDKSETIKFNQLICDNWEFKNMDIPNNAQLISEITCYGEDSTNICDTFRLVDVPNRSYYYVNGMNAADTELSARKIGNTLNIRFNQTIFFLSSSTTLEYTGSLDNLNENLLLTDKIISSITWK